MLYLYSVHRMFECRENKESILNSDTGISYDHFLHFSSFSF
uniref:Uncharacterized protein n=1 Tax=Anguilla anguilla TaxID=7936 RepID=A0A0E9PL05_ANGAN